MVFKMLMFLLIFLFLMSVSMVEIKSKDMFSVRVVRYNCFLKFLFLLVIMCIGVFVVLSILFFEDFIVFLKVESVLVFFFSIYEFVMFEIFVKISYCGWNLGK